MYNFICRVSYLNMVIITENDFDSLCVRATDRSQIPDLGSGSQNLSQRSHQRRFAEESVVVFFRCIQYVYIVQFSSSSP